MNNAAQRAANRRYKTSERGRATRRRREALGIKRQQDTSSYATRYNRNRRSVVATFLRAKKEGAACTDCGNRFPSVCMDFDHRDPESKSYSVSKMLTCSLSTIEDEIAKCDLVCANCHRIRTFARSQHLLRGSVAESAQMSLLIDTEHDKEAG